MKDNKRNNYAVFFELLKAGLWEKSIDLSKLGEIDFEDIYRISEEQSVLGLILAGLDFSDVKPAQMLLLQWISSVQIQEQQNKAMNIFIGKVVKEMREKDIYTLLVKGQGVAQCYERPLWRASGDIDFYMSESNYEEAKNFFRPLVESFDPDNDVTRHINMHYGEWVVEIHANQNISLSPRVNRILDEIHADLFYNGNVRSWMAGRTQVFLPAADDDVILVFTHLLSHFYKGGLGVRQICDWCRLLWTFRDKININILEKRLRKMRLMAEWRAFGTFAVDYLGMPSEAMPMFSPDEKWKRKADKICSFIMEVGNFGHNRDMSYYEKYPYLIRKVCSMGRRCGDVIRHVRIFPIDSLRFFPYIMYNGIRSAVRGE